MWEFNEADRSNNYLAHSSSSHKYTSKRWNGTRWVYKYPSDIERHINEARINMNATFRAHNDTDRINKKVDRTLLGYNKNLKENNQSFYADEAEDQRERNRRAEIIANRNLARQASITSKKRPLAKRAKNYAKASYHNSMDYYRSIINAIRYMAKDAKKNRKKK